MTRDIPSAPLAPPQVLRSRSVYENAWMSVREDEIRRADGSHGIYGVVEKPDFSLIIPEEAGSFHLVEQYRYPVGARFWEFPQGSWTHQPDVGDSTALARAELREETGLVADRITHLGRISVAYGYSNQGCDVFLAQDLTRVAPDREASEADMVHRKVTAAELESMIRTGSFVDATSLAALTLLRLTA